MSPDPDWTLLGRVVSGDASADEAAAVERWVAADPEHARVLELMRTVWAEAGAPRLEVDIDAGWQAVRRTMPARRTPARSFHLQAQTPARPRYAWLRVALPWAAAAALVAVAGTFAWREHRGTGTRAAPTQAAREYATTRGQRAEVTLVDGTRVLLNSDSRLRLQSGYGVRTRDVELEGEAFFVVQHDEQRPFRVHSRGAVSEDLGTEFSVRSYPEDSAVVVLVVSGRVAMRSDHAAAAGAAATPAATRGVELGRGQMGRIDQAGRVSVSDNVDLVGPLAWREGRLEFDQVPLATVLRELERWYDLDIVLEDSSLAQAPVTASLRKRTADEALGIIAGVLDLQYRRDGRQVRLMAATDRR
ncbi:MAG TPA: FecR domain-containing protein [Gemmatimonadales bacterium]|nr:FecR domain-containing protein [Gemmatimonadales bacterium]